MQDSASASSATVPKGDDASASRPDGQRSRALPVNRLKAVKGLFLLAAGLSFLLSVSLWFLADREQGLYVGLWVPSILALGALLLSGKSDLR